MSEAPMYVPQDAERREREAPCVQKYLDDKKTFPPVRPS